MPVLAHLQALEETPGERRCTARMRLHLGTVVGPCGSAVLLHDISTTGLLFETSGDLQSDRLEVELPETGPTQAMVVWRQGRFFGCRFEQPIPVSAVSAARLRAEPAGPRIADSLPPSAAAEHRPLAPRLWLRQLLVGALLTAALIYLIVAGSVGAIVAAAVITALLAAVIVLSLLWAMDNTLER